MSQLSFSEFKEKYRFDCQLSEGSFGKVCRIQCRENKKYFALKKVSTKKKQEIEDAEKEIHILKRFRHPFVVEVPLILFRSSRHTIFKLTMVWGNPSGK